jgi:plasmid stabilization system protein ParE
VRVCWARRAELDREDILAHIAVDNVLAAIATDELFGAAAGRLADLPRLGKPGMIAVTRELLVHESYRLICEVDEPDEVVWVLALVHTARRRPPLH